MPLMKTYKLFLVNWHWKVNRNWLLISSNGNSSKFWSWIWQNRN